MAQPIKHLMVGLGNPGADYVKTRHNAGEMVARALAKQIGNDWHETKGGQESIVAEGRLFIGESFMNDSGKPLAEYLKYHEVNPAQIIVLHDELDLPFGRVQLKFGAGAGGHNGVTSVINHLGTTDFWRLRIGIGRPPEPGPTVTDYVLAKFSPEEEPRLGRIIDASVTFLIDSLKRDPLQSGSIIVE